ncbi:hypothetical protein BC835DRAFT_1424438 [Cytidiella melzeri]|nr:hypothetical protein BC835DRAFT_1424438 [Cytidiella melzeri]
MNKPTLTSGRYLLQDLSMTRSFITTDESFLTDTTAKYEPVVVLPPGVLSSTIETSTDPDDIRYGKYTVKVHGMPVVQSNDGKVVAFGSGGLYNRWNIEAHHETHWMWLCSIGTPPGPEVFYWSVSHNPQDYDEHGHRRVVLKAVPKPTLTQLFVLTPLEKETEVTTTRQKSAVDPDEL